MLPSTKYRPPFGSLSVPAQRPAMTGGLLEGRDAQIRESPLVSKPLSLISPVPGGRVRGSDAFGEGGFGARRDGGKRQHQGVDITAEPAATVVSAVSGTVTKIGYPYGDDLSYRYVEVTTEDGYAVRHFYVSPADGLKAGDRVEAGRTQIGVSQDLGTRYQGITNHVHIEVRDPSGRIIDPTPWLEGTQTPGSVDGERNLP